MAKKPVGKKFLDITLIRSPIGNSKRHKATLRALGLHRIGQTVRQTDTLTVRGMLRKVNHLVSVKVKEQ
ncbi:MAG TPA: 50S ribosomal protein L30 [Anaerolineae bacterium]|nr:50S ribosomal protein L30 [Anaerolineae bacterium]